MGNIPLEHQVFMMIVIFWACFAESFREQQYGIHSHTNARCVDIPQNLSLCHNIGYTRMRLPNLLDQETLDEVSQQSAFWIPLLASRCNTNTRLFLCSLFSPVCLDQPVYPCRSLCESVRDDCEPRMAKFGFPWPGMFACNQFPVDNQLCIGQINIEESDGNVKGTGETIENIGQGGSLGFDEDKLKQSKPSFQPKPWKKGQNKNKNRLKNVKDGKENHGKNGTREPLKKEDVIRTLELICKADFAAKIKPTGIYGMEASKESRITSKKVVFYKTDDAVLRTAKSHPSDLGATHYHRYYFYTSDALLVKLSQRNLHPSFTDEPLANDTSGSDAEFFSDMKSLRTEDFNKIHESNHNFKIHKDDQLLVAGNKTVAHGKHNRLVLLLIMRIDVESHFVKKVIKMFKESSDFCKEAEDLKDPIIGEKKLKQFISPHERRQRYNSLNQGQDTKTKSLKKNQRIEKNTSRNKKNKHISGKLPSKNKNLGDNSKLKLAVSSSDLRTKSQTELTATKKNHKATFGKNSLRS